MNMNDRINLALNYRFVDEDSGATSFADYFRKLLSTLWDEGEGFSGKRPFGNSGWEWNIYRHLVMSGAVDGVLDEEGYVYNCDETTANKLVLKMIERIIIVEA